MSTVQIVYHLNLISNIIRIPQPWSLSTIMLLWHSFLIIIIIIIY